MQRHLDLSQNTEEVFKKGERTYVPDNSKELKLHITIENHFAKPGPRVYESTLELVAELNWWTDLERDVRVFTQSSIHCIISRSGEWISRPLSVKQHGRGPNEVVHADYLYREAAKGCELKYVLFIKGDISSYSWLHPCVNSDSDSVTSSIANWIACLRYMEWLVTNQGDHFTSTLLKTLTEVPHINHHFKTPTVHGRMET